MKVISMFVIIYGILILALIACLAIFTNIFLKYMKIVKEYKEMYDKALSKFNSTDNINDEFTSIYSRLNLNEAEYKKVEEQYTEMKKKTEEHIQNVGIVKYNAYEEKTGNLSFAIALADNNLDGILINKIHSNNGSNIYAKKIEKGIVVERVSEEEKEALKQVEMKKKGMINK